MEKKTKTRDRQQSRQQKKLCNIIALFSFAKKLQKAFAIQIITLMHITDIKIL